MYEMARDLASWLGPGPEPIANVGPPRHVGFYAAYLTGRPWHGRISGELRLEDLAASGAGIVVVESGSVIDQALEASDAAKLVEAFPTTVS